MLTIDDRPKTLRDLAGLERLSKEMSDYFPVGGPCTFPQVSFFEGPTGTGKTSLSYILAPMLSAPDSIRYDGELPYPDQGHEATKHVFTERFGRSVMFRDASAMSKDDIHSLEEILGHHPLFDRSMVVIIDEAQELTKGGKGAVLRLLEKKREHTYLILCTMNIEAFEKSIRSRGRVFSFKKPSRKLVAAHLFNLLEKHKMSHVPDVFIDEGLFTITDAADGSIRQAVQYLEQCVNAKLWTEAEIIDSIGLVASAKSMAEVLGRLLECDGYVLDEVVKPDPKELVFRLSYMLADAIMWQLTGQCKQDWMEAQYVRYRDTGRVRPLLETINKLCGLPYLREAVVKSELALFMLQHRSSSKPISEAKTDLPPPPKVTRQVTQEPKPISSYPMIGYCAVCGDPQYQIPSGSLCEKGHGGADTLTLEEVNAINQSEESPVQPEAPKTVRRVVL
jgi:DNA polymerase III gamma/tau subunit